MIGADRKYKKSFSEKCLNTVGLDSETSPTLLVIIGCLIAIALGLLATNGNIMVGFAPVALVAIVMLTVYRIDYSLFALIGFVILFDQYQVPGFDPLTSQLEYFKNLKEISYLPSISAGVVNPIELHLLLIFVVWFIVLAVKKEFNFNRISVWGGFLTLFGWLIFSFIMGLKQGGQFLKALWEVRALFYFGILYLVIPQVVQTRKQLKTLLWVVIAAVSIKAFQGVARFAWLGFSFQGLPTLTTHEDPVFMNTLFILLFGLWVFRSREKQKGMLSLLFLLLAGGFLVAQRRAAMAALMVSVVSFFVLLPSQKQWSFAKGAIPVLIVLLIYGAAFWNSDSKWARPVQMVKSGIMPTKKENMSKKDYYSNLFREYENYDLAYTTRIYPVFGTGFGRKFAQPLELADINFPLKDYIPHNQILWIVAKTGAIGFFLFWFFFNCFALQGAFLLHKLNSPYLKAVCMMIVVAIINQMVVSYFDLQLTFYRNMVYLGTLMGLLPVLPEIDYEQSDEALREDFVT